MISLSGNKKYRFLTELPVTSTWCGRDDVHRLIRRSGFKILMRQDSTHGKSDLSGGNESESHGDRKIILFFFYLFNIFQNISFYVF